MKFLGPVGHNELGVPASLKGRSAGCSCQVRHLLSWGSPWAKRIISRIKHTVQRDTDCSGLVAKVQKTVQHHGGAHKRPPRGIWLGSILLPVRMTLAQLRRLMTSFCPRLPSVEPGGWKCDINAEEVLSQVQARSTGMWKLKSLNWKGHPQGLVQI